MTAFRYSSYLSYQRGNDLLDRFARELFQALSNELGLQSHLPVWFDTARMPLGMDWSSSLTDALVRSVCMVPILTPTYFSIERPYCSREYLAMEVIENRRRAAMPRHESIILPVVLRGRELLPKAILEKRQVLDFADYLAFGSQQFRSRRFAKSVQSLSDGVVELLRVYDQADIPGMDGFGLPSEEEARAWLVSLGHGAAGPAFPFR